MIGQRPVSDNTMPRSALSPAQTGFLGHFVFSVNIPLSLSTLTLTLERLRVSNMMKRLVRRFIPLLI